MSSTYTPITLKGTVSSFANRDLYAELDGTGLQSQYKTFELTISSIIVQNHGDGSTREPNIYNGIDVETGMWVTDDSGNTILKIVSIESKSELSVTCIVEDVDMLSYRLKTNNTLSISGSVYIFRTNVEGEAVLATSAGFLSGAIDSIQSRFQLNETDDRVKFEHIFAPTVSVGEVVTVDSLGNLVPLNDIDAASDVKVGSVIETLRSGKDVYVKPFNDIITRYKNPEVLTGAPGTVYYSNPSLPGEITTTSGGNAVFMQLNTAIETVITATNTNLPESTDTVKINGVTVFDGPGGDTVADLAALVSLIDGFSSQTNVDASSYSEPAVVSSDDNIPAYAGTWDLHDVFIPISETGQTPSSFAEITLSDGNNSTNIVFDTPDSVVDFGGVNYDVMSPTAIKDEFQAAIDTAGLEINVTLIDLANGVGQGIKLETTGTATGITMTSVTEDAFGNTAVGTGSSTGMNLTDTVGSAVLRLTRVSGGDIVISGTPISGGYINQGGIVSSNSGRVPYLLMLEGIGDGVEATGVSVDADLDLNPSTDTSGDSAATGIYITYTPFSDSRVDVYINGLGASVGDGVKTKPFYFSAPTDTAGLNARAMRDIQAGDQLFWNASYGGFDLLTTDEIDIVYQASSLDL